MSEFKDTYSVETESDLTGLNQASEGLGSFAGAAAGAVTAIAGLAVVQQVTGFITDSITAGFEFEQQLNKIAGATGATGDELQEMKDIAHAVWEEGFGTAPEEVINALTQVANITGATGDELQALTEDALALSATFGTDVTESTTAAQRIMQQFGVDGQTAMDMIAFAMQSTGDPSGDLMATIQEFSPIFTEMGYSASGMFAVLQQGNEAGLESFGKTADAIKEFNIRTLDGSDSTKEAYNDLFATMDEGFRTMVDGSLVSINSYTELQSALADGSITMAQVAAQASDAMEGITDPVERNAIGVALLGSKWEDLGPDILAAMDMGSDGMGDYTGAMDKVKQSTLNAISPTERFKRSMQGFIAQAVNPLIAAVIEELVPALDTFTAWLKGGGLDGIEAFVSGLANDLLPILSEVITYIMDLSEQFMQFVNDNPETVAFIQKVALSIGVAVAAFVAITSAIAGATAIIGGLGAGLGVLGAALAFILSPIGLVVAAIGLLALAYQTNFLGFKDAVGSAIDYIVPKLGELYNWFMSTGLPAIQGAITAFVNDVWTPLKEGLGNLWTDIQPGLQAFWDWFITTGLPFIKLAIQLYIDNYLVPLIAMIAGFYQSVAVGLIDFAQWFLATGLPFIKLAIQQLMDNYITPLIEMVSGIYAAVSVGLDLFKNWFTSSGVPLITQKIQSVIDIFNALRDRINTIWDAVSTALNTLKTNFTSTFEAMIAPIQNVIETIQSLIDKIGDVDLGVLDDIADKAGGIFNFASPGLIGVRQGFGASDSGTGGGSNEQPIVIHSYLQVDGQVLAQTIERVNAENPSRRSRPTPPRLTLGVR